MLRVGSHFFSSMPLIENRINAVITQLRLKNWRSLRDVTIDDLQPINVFIGANSSGKTNIIDALYFMREMLSTDVIQAVSRRGGGDKILTLGQDVNEAVEIEFSYSRPKYYDLVNWKMQMIFSSLPYDFLIKRTLCANDRIIYGDSNEMSGIDTVESPQPHYHKDGEDYENILWTLFTDY